MRVVLDTNVWISGLLLPKSIPARIIQSWKEAEFTIVLSSFIVNEIKEVLEYPKIKNRLVLANEEVESFFSLLRFFAEWVDLEKVKHPVLKQLRDHEDEPILSTFIISKSDYLVTGDKDLLELSQHYPIITPGQFAEFLR